MKTALRSLGAALVLCSQLLAQADVVLLRRLFEEGLTKRRAEFGSSDPRTAQAARDLGGFLAREGDLPAAYRAFREAVSVDEAAYGPKAPQTLEDVFSAASIAPAEEQAVLLRRAAESSDPLIAGQSLSMLAGLLKDGDDTTGAAVAMRQAVAKAEEAMGSDSVIVASLLTSLSSMLSPDEAAGELRRALAIYTRALGRDDPQTATAEVLLARQLTLLGNPSAAIELGQHALGILEKAYGPQDTLTLAAARGLAAALQGSGRRQEADRILQMFNVGR